jgi:hypothetical protein
MRRSIILIITLAICFLIIATTASAAAAITISVVTGTLWAPLATSFITKAPAGVTCPAALPTTSMASGAAPPAMSSPWAQAHLPLLRRHHLGTDKHG